MARPKNMVERELQAEIASNVVGRMCLCVCVYLCMCVCVCITHTRTTRRK